MKSIAKNRRKSASRQKKNRVERKEPGGKYRVILENAAQGIIVLQNGRLQYANARARNFFGKPIEGLSPEALVNMVHPDDRSMVLGRHAQRLRGEEVPAVYPFRMVAADGQVRWVEISVSLIDWESRPAVLALVEDITEQKQAAESLKENERRYRLLAENATDVIWTVDMNLRLTYVSPAVARLRGYTPEEVMAEPLEKGYSPESWALIQKVYAEELAEEKKDDKDLSRTRTLELQHRSKDGSLVWGETKITAIRDAEGKIVEILGVTRDITERKKAQEAARRWTEENAVMAEISRIISSSPNIEEVYERFAGEVRKLIEFDNLNINLINPEERFMVVTHVSGRPIPGRGVGSIIPLEGTAVEEVLKTRSSLFIRRENLEEAVRKFPKVRGPVEAGRQSVIMAPLMREDQVFGSINIFSSRPDAYTRADVEIAEKVASQIAGAIANARLFQELQRAVEALKESEQRNRTLVEAVGISGMGIVVCAGDERGKVVCQFANEEAQKISGYTAEELRRIPFSEIIHPAHRQVASNEYWGLVGGTREPVLYQLVVRHKKGHTVLIECSAIRTLLRGEERMVAFFRDISERMRTEKELADYRAHLEQMVEERTARIHELEQQRGEIEKMAATGVLAARIAHEINNPLAGIKGAFMLIKDALPREHEYHHYIDRIQKDINRIARIVRQMFELYRPPDEDQEEWALDQMIQDVTLLLKDECREREVSFQFDLPPLQVRLPAGPVRQVLFNTIKNAVEASPLQGVVHIAVGKKEEKVFVRVRDQGPGIAEEIRPHIFKPFYTTKRGKRAGLGLGLSISKDIVEFLGGSIHFQNQAGGGVLCRIVFSPPEKKKGS
jgi:two-component system sporulation sensor kinase C